MEFVMKHLSARAKKTMHCVSRKFEDDSRSLRARLLEMTRVAKWLNTHGEWWQLRYVRRERALPGIPSRPMDFALEYLSSRSKKALRRVSRRFAKDPRSLQERLLAMTRRANDIRVVRARCLSNSLG